MDADYELDALGLRCPEPLMLLRNKVREMNQGDVIKVLATDPSTSWDFENFCRFMNHEMLEKSKMNRGISIGLKRDDAGPLADFYFAYGSNMDVERVQLRGMAFVRRCSGRLVRIPFGL